MRASATARRIAPSGRGDGEAIALAPEVKPEGQHAVLGVTLPGRVVVSGREREALNLFLNLTQCEADERWHKPIMQPNPR
jgi:hypothetical protein